MCFMMGCDLWPRWASGYDGKKSWNLQVDPATVCSIVAAKRLLPTYWALVPWHLEASLRGSAVAADVPLKRFSCAVITKHRKRGAQIKCVKHCETL